MRDTCEFAGRNNDNDDGKTVEAAATSLETALLSNSATLFFPWLRQL